MEKTLEVSLPAEIEEKASARAEREGFALAEVARRLLEEYAGENGWLTRSVVNVKLTPEQIAANMAALDLIEKHARETEKYLPEQIDVRDLLNEMRR